MKKIVFINILKFNASYAGLQFPSTFFLEKCEFHDSHLFKHYFQHLNSDKKKCKYVVEKRKENGIYYSKIQPNTSPGKNKFTPAFF